MLTVEFVGLQLQKSVGGGRVSGNLLVSQSLETNGRSEDTWAVLVGHMSHQNLVKKKSINSVPCQKLSPTPSVDFSNIIVLIIPERQRIRSSSRVLSWPAVTIWKKEKRNPMRLQWRTFWSCLSLLSVFDKQL